MLIPSYLKPDSGLIWLMTKMILKLSFTTGAIISVPFIYALETRANALRVPAPEPSREVVSIEKAKARKAVA
jgi:hypothetical protein